MSHGWMQWCRLCGREDSTNSHIHVALKDEEGLPLSDTIYKCFSIDMKSSNNLPNRICNECYLIVKATIDLNQKIPKVNAMFTALLVKTENDEEFDFKILKILHDLQCDVKPTLSPKKDATKLIEFSSQSIQFQNMGTISGKVEKGEGHNCDKLPSPDRESSNESISHEKTKKPKTYKSRNVRLVEGKAKTHYCAECQKGFMNFANYRRHMQVVHEIIVENKKKIFICGKCGRECKSSSSLKDHEFSHSEERTFKCQSCEKAFKSIRSLKQHEDTHNETRYICVVCGLQLNTQQTLSKHMVVHSDVRKYKCDHCGNGFKRVKALKAHLILHTGLRPYTCDFCNKTFANVSNCRGHKKKYHPVELAAFEASGKVSTAVVPKLKELRAMYV